MVLHAVLRHPARRAGQAAWRHRHGWRDVRPAAVALAGPQSGQVDSLSQQPVQAVADGIRRNVHRAGLSRPAGADQGCSGTGLARIGTVLPVLRGIGHLQQGALAQCLAVDRRRHAGNRDSTRSAALDILRCERGELLGTRHGRQPAVAADVVHSCCVHFHLPGFAGVHALE